MVRGAGKLSGERGNVWMKWEQCECPTGRIGERERVEKRDRRRENKEGREHGGQHRVSLSILPQEKKKLKIPSSFFPPREGVSRDERVRDRKLRKKAFPSPLSPPPFPAWGCPSLSSILFCFVLFLSAETRAGSCVIHVGYSTLFSSGGV